MKKIYFYIPIVLVCQMSTVAQTITCDDTSIFVIGNSTTASLRGLHKFTKTSSSLNYAGQIGTIPNTTETAGAGLGLAIADLGDGQRFYTSDYAGHILEFDGTSWNTLATVSDGTLNNPGGKNEFLYYQKYSPDFSVISIVRYQNGMINEIWNDPATQITLADLAVDDVGNVYFFTGTNAMVDYMTDTLNVMSPNGTILHQYSISFDFLGGYGLCFLNGGLYMFFTESNSDYPGKMVRIELSGSSAITTTQYLVPKPVVGTATNGPIYLNVQDADTCSSSGNFLGVDDVTPQDFFEMFPNPSTTQLHINAYQNGKLTIFNALGQKVMHQDLNSGVETILDIRTLASGMYLVNVELNGNHTTKKFIKQ
ncbi:MAG: T9SS type A sorting domain-containing protein [Gelidibacter sp.]